MNHRHSYPRRSSFVASLFLISASVLIFEILLTRIFSVILSYHYTFAAISVALLGLGIGAALLPRWQRLTDSSEIIGAYLMVLTLAGSVSLILVLPIHENGLLVRLRFWIYLPLVASPFFFAGLTIASLFQRLPDSSSYLYAADLLGAALGALIVVPLLNQLGGVKTALVPIALAFLSVLLLQRHYGNWSGWALPRMALMLLAILGLYIVSQHFEIPIAKDPGKDMYHMLHNEKHPAEVVETRWSAFGRTDVVQSKMHPNEKVLFVDGAAGTSMYRLETGNGAARLGTDVQTHFGGYFPFLFLREHEKNNALIIGPGGGRDVLVALLGGVESIVAAEVNPQIVQIVKDQEAFNGGIYTRFPNVKVVVAEGRHYLRSSDAQYDLIILTLPLTKSSRSVEGYMLTENYLFTVEAMQDYLDHLTPEGRLILVVHDTAEVYRLVVLAAQAFGSYGVEAPDMMKHLYVLGSGMMPTVVIKKRPFEEDEIQRRHAQIHKLRYDKGGFFIPYTQQVTFHVDDQAGPHKMQQMLDPALLDVSKGELSIEELIERASLDLTPVTDDRPFFYKFQRGIPGTLATLVVLTSFTLIGLLVPFPRPIKALRTRLGFARRGTGLRIESPLDMKILKESLGFVRVPWQFFKLDSFPLIFTGLGIGFMLLEIALFQRLTLLLDQPQWALTILLFSLLIGTGVGSLCSSLVRQHVERTIAITSTIVAVLASVYARYLLDILGIGLTPRLIVPLLILPFGFVLGFPFPLTLRLLPWYGRQESVHRMWAVNSVASVLGSALAMIVGIVAGFSYALYAGAMVYAGVALIALKRSCFPATREHTNISTEHSSLVS